MFLDREKTLPTLGVGLVFAVAVALGRPPTHLGLLL